MFWPNSTKMCPHFSVARVWNIPNGILWMFWTTLGLLLWTFFFCKGSIYLRLFVPSLTICITRNLSFGSDSWLLKIFIVFQYQISYPFYIIVFLGVQICMDLGASPYPLETSLGVCSLVSHSHIVRSLQLCHPVRPLTLRQAPWSRIWAWVWGMPKAFFNISLWFPWAVLTSISGMLFMGGTSIHCLLVAISYATFSDYGVDSVSTSSRVSLPYSCEGFLYLCDDCRIYHSMYSS